MPEPPAAPAPAQGIRSAALIVVNPSGNRSRVPIDPVPFTIGRHAENCLVLRDNRTSRFHARISLHNGEYTVEDLDSRHGVTVNGERISGQAALRNGDTIEFGVRDSYQLVFSLEEAEIQRLLDQFNPASTPSRMPAAGGLAKLRALVEVARALQSSLSIGEVLAAVVDAALTVTGAERGFLLLKQGDDLEVRVARDAGGSPLSKDDLRVPTRLIHRALTQRRELLSMNFDPQGGEGVRPDLSVASLELRSVVCVPLVRVRTAQTEETSIGAAASDTAGLLYLDTRIGAADLSAGNRELLQTLALEASTILENARLLEEEQTKLRLERELNLAREIQESLFPRSLPETGWFRAAASSLASHSVAGDYYDVRQTGPDSWSAVVADVSGKGVSSALLAALLQGAFLLASEGGLGMDAVVARVNRFLNERTEGEKYATMFYCTLDAGGRFRYINAGHCPPSVVRPEGRSKSLPATGMPVGLLPEAEYTVGEAQLQPGDKVVIFSDGLPEAEDVAGQFFGMRRMRSLVLAHAAGGCREMHDALVRAVKNFTSGTVQKDDATLLVLEYQPPAGE